jgi:hypothetical protein
VRLFVAVLLFAVAISCAPSGRGFTPTPTPTPMLSLNPPSLTFATLGTQQTFQVDEAGSKRSP